MSTLLVKSAKILDSESPYHLQTKDIKIKDGLIAEIKESISGADQVINFDNLHVSSGFFDSSVCFGEPGFEERETLAHGATVARQSGFTSLLLNANLQPVTENFSAVKFLQQQVDPQLIDIRPLGALTTSFDGTHLAELYDMQMAGAAGFYDFKTPIKDANVLKIALQYAKTFAGVVFSYPQNSDITGTSQVNEDEFTTYIGLKGMPNLAEELQIARDLSILEYTGGQLHIPTISTENSIQLIKKAKDKGLRVSCSVALPHLVFTSAKLDSFDSKYKIQPPLRTQKDVDALKKAVSEGIVDMVTCDHEPINEELKDLEFENASYGSIGLESAFSVTNTLFGAEKASELLSKTKSHFGIETSKIEVGQRADLSLFDPHSNFKLEKKQLLSTSKNCIFLGEKLKGKVLGSIYNNSFYEN